MFSNFKQKVHCGFRLACGMACLNMHFALMSWIDVPELFGELADIGWATHSSAHLFRVGIRLFGLAYSQVGAIHCAQYISTAVGDWKQLRN